MEELVQEFKELSEEEKLAFIREVMPDLSDTLEKNPDFMEEMMDMIIDKVDTFQMLNMMGKIM